MKFYLQTGFGEPIGAPANDFVRLCAFDGCRIGGSPSVSDAQLTACIQEVEDADLAPLVIVWSLREALAVPAGVDVEFMNEPDLTAISPEEYAAEAMAIQEARGWVWAGSISNLNDHGFDYLRRMLAAAPGLRRISIHRYPRNLDVNAPQSGFPSREAEIVALRRLIGDREWGVSEFGYHTGREHWWRRRLTDYQVAERVEWEWRFWRRMGATFATLYQINDGPTAVWYDRYGIRHRSADNTRFDGPPKNVANSVHRVKGT